MKKINKISLIIASFLLFFSSTMTVQAEIDPKFNPGMIISDSEMLDTKSMSLEDVKNFLNRYNGFINTYYTYNAHGTANKSAADIIYEAATANYDCEGVELSESPTEAEKKIKCKIIDTINPKFLLVLLQKEQSLIEEQSPKESQLDWATGYGCPDNWTCNPYYKGFGKQINSASLQFRYYVDHPEEYKYQKGKTYTFTNPYGVDTKEPISVTIENDATAALYNYTPHVFNGNYNFFKLWEKYFPGSSLIYPNGSLLQARGEIGVWLIENGQKRPFTTYGALTSRFDKNKIISVDKSVLDNYEKGEPIKFPNYSLIQTPDKKIYLLVDNHRRLIPDMATFKKIGFNLEEILDAEETDLNSYLPGQNITATSTNITGTLMQSTKTGGIFFVQDDTKAPLLDKVFLTTKFKGKKIIKATETELTKYTKISPILFGNGELLKSATSPAVYLIENGKKRPFNSGEVFEKLGYKWENIITISPQLLALYPQGESVIIPEIK